MKYTEYQPSEKLAEYIQLIWTGESEKPADAYPREKIFPDGIVELVFHLREPFFTFTAEGRKIKQARAFVISQMKNFVEIESEGNIGLVSVRFYPWGAYHFFDEPIRNFLDGSLNIEQLWPEDAPEILTDIKTASVSESVVMVQNFLEKMLRMYQKDSENIDRAIKLIRDSKGQLPIEELCKRLHIHHKQLERKFLNTIGTTPKVFSRNTRFLHLCHHLKEYENLTMSQLAYQLGYYDQAHFIRDFKDFSGMTPKHYYRQKNICFANL